jgi:hypothetical protein
VENLFLGAARLLELKPIKLSGVRVWLMLDRLILFFTSKSELVPRPIIAKKACQLRRRAEMCCGRLTFITS